MTAAPVFNPLNSIADAFDLHILAKKFADKSHAVMVGPFPLNLPLKLTIDQLTASHASATVRVRKDIWAFIISGKKTLSILLYNGTACHGHPLGNTRDTFQAILPFAKAAFDYDTKSHQWQATSLDALVKRFKV